MIYFAIDSSVIKVIANECYQIWLTWDYDDMLSLWINDPFPKIDFILF
jgi:hypothetical protein